jgi:hypothetical protein
MAFLRFLGPQKAEKAERYGSRMRAAMVTRLDRSGAGLDPLSLKAVGLLKEESAAVA